MTYGRTFALALAALLVAGCSGVTASDPPAAVAHQATPDGIPAGSSAAAHILAHVDTTRRAASAGPGYDDGGRSSLQLPPIVACGNGAFSNDCADWVFSGNGSTPGPCTRVDPNCSPGTPAGPPDLNFCAGTYPSDIAPPATAAVAPAPQTFSLAYGGTQNGPIVTFSTRWWAVNVTGSFAGTSTSAPALTVTPVASPYASRGWLLFFTWSWPADVLLLPYQVNEIQLSAASVPLPVSGTSPAQLGAFDCLGRSIGALAAGKNFGFSSNLRSRQTVSPGSEMNVPVWFSAGASGAILLYDDRGATALTTVGGGAAFF